MHEMIAHGFGQREVALVDIKFRLGGRNLTGPYCSRPCLIEYVEGQSGCQYPRQYRCH